MFKKGKFKLHSGGESEFKIVCDTLTKEDLEALAYLVSKRITNFHSVTVPADTTSLTVIDFSNALEKYADTENGKYRIIVDDVLTTGSTMEETKANFFPDEPIIGVVIFARGMCPTWVHPIFELYPIWDDV